MCCVLPVCVNQGCLVHMIIVHSRAGGPVLVVQLSVFYVPVYTRWQSVTRTT